MSFNLNLFIKRIFKQVFKGSKKWIAVVAIVCILVLVIDYMNLSTKLLQMENQLVHFESNLLRKRSAYTVSNAKSFTLSRTDFEDAIKNKSNNNEDKEGSYNFDTLSLNNTRLADTQILVFNRVPKAGSAMFLELIRILAIRNNFTVLEPKMSNPVQLGLTKDEQRHLAVNISQLAEFSVYQGHIAFLNLTEFNLAKPIYINIVRDPVERAISWFYYIRAPWYFIERYKRLNASLPKLNWLHKDYETCVLTNDVECTYIRDSKNVNEVFRLMQFFCGFDEYCLPFSSQSALDGAKNSVATQFSVVGVLEDFNTTLAVFEKYIPRFFAGATEVYFKNLVELKGRNKNTFKIPVSEEVKNIVRQNFSKEIEFYEFCKERLRAQFLATN